MKVLIILPKITGKHDIGKSMFYDTFLEVYKNNPDYECELLFYQENNPDLINTQEQLNRRMLWNDFDICFFVPCFRMTPCLDTAKALGKKLFFFIYDCYYETYHIYPFPEWGTEKSNNICSNRRTNFRMFIKSEKVIRHHIGPHTPFQLSEYSNLMIQDYGVDEEEFPNVYCTFFPHPVNTYKPCKEEEKIYDVSFGGSFHTPERKNTVDILEKAGIEVHKFGLLNVKDDAEKETLTHNDFADNISRSKITLNFNRNRGLLHKLSRMYEAAACRTFIMTKDPEPYYSRGKWAFKPGEHFVTFDESNVVDVVRYYLNNPEERIKISNAMHEYWKNNYTSKHFWDSIFNIYNKSL